MADIIKFSDLFDFSNPADIEKAIKTIQKLDKTYQLFIKGLKTAKGQASSDLQAVIKATQQLDKVVKTLNPTLEKDQQQLAAAAKSMDILTSSSANLVKKTVTLTGSLDKLTKEQEEFNAKAKETIKLQNEEARLIAKLNSLETEEAKNIQKLRTQIQEKNKALKQSAKESLGLVSIYDKESAKLNELRKRYKEVALAEGESSKAARVLRKELTALDAKLKSVDGSAGQFQRSVGNYPSAFKRAAAGARQLATALGFTGVIFALVGAFRNAFNAIREFDKEMTNLSAIAGETREDFSGVEKEIRRVAKTSINTANEVAKTATALITLGKTKTEIIDLLEPVNNLSIALQAPADAAGELLIGTLNAFGESSEAAGKYADIIAKMRTSTALDFERIQDSLGFLAPTANAAGVSFERTGAILGVLVDNSVKAARAGRLMSTSFLRLAEQGKTLDEALTELNLVQQSTNDELVLLAKSSDLFGKESAALGLILASNISKIDDYDKSFQNAGGTLNDLTNKQLKSLDAQLKILDSTWTELILSLENGEGAIASFLSGFIGGLTKAIAIITAAENGTIGWGEALSSLKDPLQASIVLSKISAKEAIVAAKEQKRLAGIQTQAQYLYNEALENGAKTFSDYENKFSSAIDQNINKTEILTAIQKLYNDQLKKTTEEEEKARLARELAAKESEEERQSSIEYFEKFGAAIQNGGETARKGLEPLETGLTVTIPDSIDALEEKALSFGERFSMFWQKAGEDIKQAMQAAFEAASIAVNQFFTNRSINRENAFVKFEELQNAEIDKLEERRDKELENENLTADAKEAINKRYNTQVQALEEQTDNKRKELQRKQAIAQKKQAIFNVVLSTSQAIISALAQVPKFDFGISAGAIAASYGILGAAQIAAIASQPIPAFAKGTDSAPGGLAIVGDGGNNEVVMEPSGKVYVTGSTPELRDIPARSKVFPSIDAAVDSPIGSTLMNNLLSRGIDEQQKDNNRSAAILQKVAEQNKIGNIVKEFKLTMEADNKRVIEGFQKAVSKIPVHLWKFNDKGQPVRDIMKGNTIYKNVENENSY